MRVIAGLSQVMQHSGPRFETFTRIYKVDIQPVSYDFSFFISVSISLRMKKTIPRHRPIHYITFCCIHYVLFFHGTTASSLLRLHHHTQDAPRSVLPLWTIDKPDAETSTWQHSTLTRHPCSWRDSNQLSACVRPQTPVLCRAAPGIGPL